MKTFKTHIKERYSGSDKTAASVGTSTANGVEDSNIGVHNIHDADVLKRIPTEILAMECPCPN